MEVDDLFEGPMKNIPSGEVDNFQLSFKAKAWPWNGLTSWETRELEAADGQSGGMVRGY